MKKPLSPSKRSQLVVGMSAALLSLCMATSLCLGAENSKAASKPSGSSESARQTPEKGSTAEVNPAPEKFTPDPSLPDILLLGDSISMGYTPFVRELMKGKANVFRPAKPDGTAANCSDTAYGLAQLDHWLAVRPKWSVIHFNWGLHDLKHMVKGAATATASRDPNDPPLHNLDEYKANMEQIIARLKKTGAHLILATTTPVPEGVTKPFFRSPADPPRYNAVAIEVAKGNGIAVNDLFAFIQPRVAELQNHKGVHFNEAGSRALAEQVAKAIVVELPAKAASKQ